MESNEILAQLHSSIELSEPLCYSPVFELVMVYVNMLIFSTECKLLKASHFSHPNVGS